VSRSGSRTVRCSLCGHGFEPAGLACHAECPLGPRCGLICCPSCGYQVVDESRTLIGRLLRRRFPAAVPRARPDGAARPSAAVREVPLTHVPTGMTVCIRSLREMPPSRRARLSALGVVPGSEVLLVQRRPAPVIRIGQTEVAVSEQILGEIRVEPPPRSAATGPEASGS
jgi:Fe2+ transport system protein FeoA